MKYFELDASEKKLLKDFELGKLKSIKNVAKEKASYQKLVASALKKNKNINIRLSETDLFRLKARASEDGIPYQTYLASLVHKHLRVR